MSGYGDKELLIKILSLEYPVNNIGSKRAITWVANAMGIFEDEVEDYTKAWGDIGEGIQELDGSMTDSTITLNMFHQLLNLDCSRLNSNSYTTFSEEFDKMSAREKKWFLRYWLRKPRNGVNNKIPLKALTLHYSNLNIEKYARM